MFHHLKMTTISPKFSINAKELAELEKILDYSKTGSGLSAFINIGNTCYLNSALQVLVHIPEIYQIFLETEKLFLEKRGNFEDKDMNFYSCFKAIYRGFWEDDCLIRPIGLARYLDKYTHFSFGEQSDSTEVLTCIIQKIHESICVPKVQKAIASGSSSFIPSPMPRLVSNELYSDLEVLAKKEWEIHLEGKESKLVDLFWGQYINKIKCLHCGSKSQKFETFHYLTLQATIENEDDPESPIDIDKLFDNFLASKKFDKENKYFCEKCKHNVDNAFSKFQLWNLPNYLIIQFKRYYNPKCSKDITKSRREIHYPLEFNPKKLLNSHSLYHDKNLTYKLQSGVFHMGDLFFGHYTCYCWNDDTKEWIHFNDNDVSLMDENVNQIGNENIYQLVYILNETSH